MEDCGLTITLELRALQTIDSLGTGPSNTVILFPVEMLSATAGRHKTCPYISVMKSAIKKERDRGRALVRLG